MTDRANIGRFAINENLDGLQDILDIEYALDVVCSLLMDVEGINPELWESLEFIRERMDAARDRATMLPHMIRKLDPETHTKFVVPVQ